MIVDPIDLLHFYFIRIFMVSLIIGLTINKTFDLAIGRVMSIVRKITIGLFKMFF